MKKGAIFILSIVIIYSFSLASASSQGKVKVIVEKANIRLQPDSISQIIAQAPLDSILEFTSKTGEWYAVTLPPDESGFIISGYIHQSMVEEVKKDLKPPVTPPVHLQPVEREQIPYEPELPPTPKGKLFSGFSLKFGWMNSPDAGGFSYAWLSAIGFDLGLHRNFSLGLEIQPAYRNYSEIDLSIIPLMGFMNAKAGLKLLFANLFVGGGVGLEATYSSLKFEGETLTDFDTKLAYHVIAGLEFDLRAVTLIAEYQMTQISDPDIDPNFWRHYLLFGFRF